MAFQDRGIHSFKECVPEGSDYFQQTLGEEEALPIRREEKMGAIEDQDLAIQRISLKQ